MNSEKRVQAAIAGLLHDIGKLEQRARSDPWNNAPGVDREGQPVHATWTTYFIQNNVPEAYRKAAYAGAYHHQPEKSPAEDQSLSMLVALADKLSAGERADPVEEGGQIPQQMVSIFDRLVIGDQSKKEGWHYLPLKLLTLNKHVIFPDKQITKEASKEAYEKLCNSLQYIARTDPGEPEAYLENLLGGMQASTWCVPSAYYHSLPDVSLYDHSRMTAALAACMADLEPAHIQELLAAVRQEFSEKAGQAEQKILAEPLVLLIGGDISGVQDFIYTISSKNAAKTLRGRSFYLQLLTEAVLRFVLRELGLPYTNVIYSGGGHFFLLAPISAESLLPDLQEQITRKLLKHHGVNLYLAVAGQPVPANGFKIGQFPVYWSAMHHDLAQAKQQRYTELGKDLYEKVFAVSKTGGNPDQTCSVCGEDHRAVMLLDEDREEQSRICSLCSSFDEQIGRRLPQAAFVALGLTQPLPTEPGTAASALQEFGMKFTFIESRHDSIGLSDIERVVLWALEDPNQGWPASTAVPTSHMLRYTVNRVPQMTFDELQEQVSSGFHRLGVLRMDVDNLGTIFSDGFGAAGDPKSCATLARLSTLSFEISLYFEGWVKKLCEERDGKIYAVYAGGDDLFLIGPWDMMPKLASEIRQDFNQYTAGHPGLHLSGGMAFIGGKYPVYQAARDASEAESQAKNSSPEKNAFSFLGQAWSWPKFELLAEKQARLVRLVSQDQSDAENLGGPRAILGVLRQLSASEARAAGKTGRPVWGPWMWMGAYQLTRMAERYKKNQPELAAEIESIREDLGANNYADIQMWGAAARWAQLATRKSTEHDKEV